MKETIEHFFILKWQKNILIYCVKFPIAIYFSAVTSNIHAALGIDFFLFFFLFCFPTTPKTCSFLMDCLPGDKLCAENRHSTNNPKVSS